MHFNLQYYMKLGTFEPHFIWIQSKLRENSIIGQPQIRKQL